MKSESSWTKKRLAVELSRLEEQKEIDVKLEQYPTPSETAADWLWKAAFRGDIRGKVSVDAGCGAGILGCGALLLGAKKVIFVDKDKKMIELAKNNVNKLKREYEIGKSEFYCGDIADFDGKADVVLQNPPFGTKKKHADKIFLEKAFGTGDVVYSMHKSSTSEFVEAMARDHSFKITEVWSYDLSLKRTQKWHKKDRYHVDVSVWRMEKQ